MTDAWPPKNIPIFFSDDAVCIVHGGCRDILPMLQGSSIDMVFTDPPYGHNNNNGDLIQRQEAALGRGPAGAPRAIANDGADANDLVQFLFAESAHLLKPGAVCCCCGGGGPDPQFARWSLWMGEQLQFKQMVVWDKRPIGMGWHYRRSYETVLVGEQPGAACKWYDTTSRVENIIRHIPKHIPQAADHPTPKPLALIKHFLLLHSQPGDVVLDPFMGRGSTLRACKDTGRRGIGIEIDASECALAGKRMEQQVLPLGWE